jgi:hypothetical protein
MRLNLPVIFIRRFTDIAGFTFLCGRFVLDHTDQNQNERLVKEGAINQFLG